MKKVIKFIKGFRKGMENFGSNLSIIVNSVLLLIVYIIGAGITSLFAKIFKKHFLELKPSDKSRSYWSDLDFKNKKLDDYYRQF